MILTAFCDLSFCPVSYDFVVWLARAMVECDAAGCDGLHVVLVPHERGLGGFARQWGEHDEADTRWRLWHIVMGCAPLAGVQTTVTLAANRGQAEALRSDATWWPESRAHLAGPLIAASRNGKMIPKLRPTEAARRHVSRWFVGETRPIVTLTTRHQATHADRNSDEMAWDRFAEWLSGRYAVVRLQDTHVALGRDRGAWAELSPDLRLALYERAAMNCIGNNGPAALLWFSSAPFRQFGFCHPRERWVSHMREHLSLEFGDQVPWFGPKQRLVWKPDSFEVLRDESGLA
jgi:hypothetical protein